MQTRDDLESKCLFGEIASSYLDATIGHRDPIDDPVTQELIALYLSVIEYLKAAGSKIHTDNWVFSYDWM